MRSPGGWHHAGQPIVYLAESAAGALLEVYVHTSANDVPQDFVLLKIEAPEIQVKRFNVMSCQPGGNRSWISRGIWDSMPSEEGHCFAECP